MQVTWFGLLQLLLIAAKIWGVVDWAWWQVLIVPILWVVLVTAICIAQIILVLISAGIKAYCRRWNKEAYDQIVRHEAAQRCAATARRLADLLRK